MQRRCGAPNVTTRRRFGNRWKGTTNAPDFRKSRVCTQSVERGMGIEMAAISGQAYVLTEWKQKHVSGHSCAQTTPANNKTMSPIGEVFQSVARMEQRNKHLTEFFQNNQFVYVLSRSPHPNSTTGNKLIKPCYNTLYDICFHMVLNIETCLQKSCKTEITLECIKNARLQRALLDQIKRILNNEYYIKNVQ